MSLKEYVFMSLCLQLNYGIEEYVFMSLCLKKDMSFCLEEVLLYILKAIQE